MKKLTALTLTLALAVFASCRQKEPQQQEVPAQPVAQEAPAKPIVLPPAPEQPASEEPPKPATRTISLLNGKVTYEVPNDERIYEYLKFRYGIDMYNIGILDGVWENERFKTCEPRTYSPLLMDIVFADGRTLVPEHVLQMLADYKLEDNEEFAITPSKQWEDEPRQNYLRSSYTKLEYNEKIIGESLFKISKEEFDEDGEVSMSYDMYFLVDDNIAHIDLYILCVKAEDILAACPEFIEQKDGVYRFKSKQAMDEFYALMESGETERMPEILQLLHTTKEMVLSTLTIKDSQ